MFRFAAHDIAIEIQGEVWDVRIAEDTDEVPSVQSIPRNNDVILHPNLFSFGLQDVGGRTTGQPMTKPLPGLHTASQVRRPLHEKRRDDHRKHGYREKDLIWIAPEETGLLPLLRQQKTKLSDLSQSDTHHDRLTRRNRRRQGRSSPGNKLPQHNQHEQSGHRQRVLEQHPPVHEDADRYEEEAVETVAERQHFGHGLVAILRFGNDQPGNECPQCQREASERGEPRNAETGHDDGQQE